MGYILQNFNQYNFFVMLQKLFKLLNNHNQWKY